MTSNRPKVLFDISVLGQAYANHYERTGVARVVENLASGLASSDQIQLQLVAGQVSNGTSFERFRNLYHSISFIESHAVLKGIHLAHPKMQRLLFNLVEHRGRVKRAAFHPAVNLFNTRMFQDLYTKADILHCDFFGFPPESSRAPQLLRFLTVHDLGPIKFPHWYSEPIKEAFRQCFSSIRNGDSAICVSESTRKDLLAHFPQFSERVFVAYPAADQNIFYNCTDQERIKAVKETYNIKDSPYILCISGGSGGGARKNLPHLLRSFSQLTRQEHSSGLKLVVVAANFEDVAKELSNMGNSSMCTAGIQVISRVSDDELAPLYSGASMFAYPSLYEGFGLPVLEAMQCGVPVLTSNTSSLPEIVGDAGITLEPSDENAWCRNMQALHLSPALRHSMSLKSIEQAKKFSWQKSVQQVLSAYKTILGDGNF